MTTRIISAGPISRQDAEDAEECIAGCNLVLPVITGLAEATSCANALNVLMTMTLNLHLQHVGLGITEKIFRSVRKDAAKAMAAQRLYTADGQPITAGRA